MKKLLSLLLVGIAFIPALAGDFPKGSPDFKTDFTTTAKTAKAEGLPMILVFSAAWCPPCQTMKNEVYPSSEVEQYHDKFVWAYLDVDDPQNAAVSNHFGVNGIPHIQFLAADGSSLGQQVGAESAKDFARTLKSVLKHASK
ncbi:MAG: thioredoxin family protein [Verrucomicrobiales bacterium]|nr:thioredoxin family protein [Verrucomicrobiales bacterium]